jgi:putative redox protein
MTRRAAAVALRSSSSSRTMPGAGSRLAVNRIVAVALAGHGTDVHARGSDAGREPNAMTSKEVDLSDAYRVELRTVDGGPTALGSAGPFTLVADRPVAGGGGGLGFNGGQLLYLAIAACYSNDLYREAATRGIALRRVAVTVDGDFPGRGAASTPIVVDVELDGDAPEADLRALLDEVHAIAEIPRSLREGTEVELRGRLVRGTTRS